MPAVAATATAAECRHGRLVFACCYTNNTRKKEVMEKPVVVSSFGRNDGAVAGPFLSYDDSYVFHPQYVVVLGRRCRFAHNGLCYPDQDHPNRH